MRRQEKKKIWVGRRAGQEGELSVCSGARDDLAGFGLGINPAVSS
jgi:hypothetical protein